MDTNEGQHVFLGSEIPDLPRGSSRFHVIPVPFEQSVCYGAGTADGPSAILRASWQLEAFDGQSVPCERGIWTAPPVVCTGPVEDVLARVACAVGNALTAGAIPFVLGGEHTVTLGVVRALLAAGRTFGIVQFDAHADLRKTYEGNSWSHACVMHRALDLGIPVFQIGVRALSTEEVALRAARNVGFVDAEEVAAGRPVEPLLPTGFPEDVCITFDVDAFDSALMPATGTPEPGGLTWWQAMRLLKQIAHERRVVAADVVELAPIPGFHAPDFAAARLAYNLMGMIARSGA